MKNVDMNLPAQSEMACEELDINLSGPIRMVHHLLAHLKQQPSALIVNVTSGLAFIPMFSAPVYCATKAGLHSFSISLRAQLEGSSVKVVELAPPAVDTPLFHGVMGAEASKQQAMPVDKLVEQALRGIESDRDEIRPGLANVLYAMSRLAPRFMFGQLTKMTRKAIGQ